MYQMEMWPIKHNFVKILTFNLDQSITRGALARQIARESNARVLTVKYRGVLLHKGRAKHGAEARGIFLQTKSDHFSTVARGTLAVPQRLQICLRLVREHGAGEHEGERRELRDLSAGHLVADTVEERGIGGLHAELVLVISCQWHK